MHHDLFDASGSMPLGAPSISEMAVRSQTALKYGFGFSAMGVGLAS
jgi:hypothetical protein